MTGRNLQTEELVAAIKRAREKYGTFAGDCEGVHIRDIAKELDGKPTSLRGRMNRSPAVELVYGFDPKRGQPFDGWALIEDDEIESDGEPEAAL